MRSTNLYEGFLGAFGHVSCWPKEKESTVNWLVGERGDGGVSMIMKSRCYNICLIYLMAVCGAQVRGNYYCHEGVGRRVISDSQQIAAVVLGVMCSIIKECLGVALVVVRNVDVAAFVAAIARYRAFSVGAVAGR